MERLPVPPPDVLPPPAARFAAVAKSDPTPIRSDFQPTDTHRALAATLFESKAGSFLELAEASGVSRSHLYRILADPDAVKWIVAHSAGISKAALPAVYAQLLHKALNERGTSAIRLFLERFDVDFKPKEMTIGTSNTQNNYFGYTTAELEAIVRQKTRTLLGESVPTGDGSPPSEAQG